MKHGICASAPNDSVEPIAMRNASLAGRHTPTPPC